MKKLYRAIFTFAAIAIATMANAENNIPKQGYNQGQNQMTNNKPLNIRTVNFKKSVEQSKMGKQEQSSFDALKKQMESVLGEKEKTLNEMAAKFEDPDYLDSLSADTETELKRKFRSLSQEFSLLQNQYFQSLQQTNFKIVQKLTETVGKAANEVAKQKQYDFILNEEAAFFASPQLDVTSEVVVVMDRLFDTTEKKTEAQLPPTPKK